MIQNPKSLTEQLLNLAERMAIELRVVLKTTMTKLDAKKWNDLKSLAFKDSVPSTKYDKMNPDPVAFFKQKYGS